jgi:hypothetical protein
LSCSVAWSYFSPKATRFAFSCWSSSFISNLIEIFSSSKAAHHLAFSCSSSSWYAVFLAFASGFVASSQYKGGTSGGWPYFRSIDFGGFGGSFHWRVGILGRICIQ